MCDHEEEIASLFLESAQLLLNKDYNHSVNVIVDNQYITTIVNFATRTKRIVPKELRQSGVIYSNLLWLYFHWF